jgi:hypothetical protein
LRVLFLFLHSPSLLFRFSLVHRTPVSMDRGHLAMAESFQERASPQTI